MTGPDQSSLRRIAVWLQLERGQELRGEGIGEHLMRLLKGLSDLGQTEQVVFAPRWAGRIVRPMLEEHGLAETVTLRLFGFAPSRPRLPFLRRRPKHVGDPMRHWYARRLVDVPLWVWVLLALPAIVLAPVMLVLRLIARAPRILVNRVPRLRGLVQRALELRSAFAYAAMARAIDNDPRIEGCIVPIGNWDYCRYIERKPLVVQIPDIVFMEFPDHFKGDAGALALMERIRYVGRHARAVVCPSDYVKATHLVRGLGLPDSKVHVINHAPMRLDVAFAQACAARGLAPAKAAAVAICREFQEASMLGATYLRRVGGSAYWLARARDRSVWDRPKLYFPTQYRPYKNIELAIEAVARLRDRHGLLVSLFITGDLAVSKKAFQLIDKLRLHDQVIPLPRVPLDAHAALYKAADLAIAASSFEGGFPFIFSEAVSLDTPIVMARIPVTLEKIHGPMLEAMTYDPLDLDGLARLVRKELESPSLIGPQRALFQEIYGNRTWTTVAQDYLRALEAPGA